MLTPPEVLDSGEQHIVPGQVTSQKAFQPVPRVCTAQHRWTHHSVGAQWVAMLHLLEQRGGLCSLLPPLSIFFFASMRKEGTTSWEEHSGTDYTERNWSGKSSSSSLPTSSRPMQDSLLLTRSNGTLGRQAQLSHKHCTYRHSCTCPPSP